MNPSAKVPARGLTNARTLGASSAIFFTGVPEGSAEALVVSGSESPIVLPSGSSVAFFSAKA